MVLDEARMKVSADAVAAPYTRPITPEAVTVTPMALWLRRGPYPAIKCLKLQTVRYHAYTGSSFPNGIPPPLRGIKVLDLTRVLAGPTATMVCLQVKY